jgi:hypothetical protein
MKRLIMAGLAVLVSANMAWAGELAANTNPALFHWQAFALLPQLGDAEYSADTDYNKAPLNEAYDKLVGRFDNSFRVIRKGPESQVECNWGIDFSDGPLACLPHLAKAKWIAQINANIRGPYFLRKGKRDNAIAETIAVFKMGRDVARDGTLLSILVQSAVENINVKFIADHFGTFEDSDLQRLADAVAALPVHLSVKHAMPLERSSFLTWYKTKLQYFIDHPSANGALADARDILVETIGSGEGQNNVRVPDEIIRDAGGTAQGLIAYLDGLNKWYDEADAVLAFPNAELIGKLDAFGEKIEKTGSVIAKEFLPALGKAQRKDFWTQTRLAMLDAALAYRLHGKAGFDTVKEPVVEGNFQLTPTSEGFEIRSSLPSEFGPDKEKGKPITLTFTAKK